MVHDPRASLFDVQRAIAAIETFVAGKSSDEFANTLMMRLAVERQFGIVGEALTRLEKVDKDIAGRISEFRGFISFGISLVTNYKSINDAVT
jgi:uncharacterized protein with HEPN domain